MNDSIRDSRLDGDRFLSRVRLPRLRLSLSTLILIGMVAGILVGIVFGEYVAFLDVVGNAFIKLLQMTILPYIVVSLIVGIGGLTFAKAKMLATTAGIWMLVYWGIAFFFVLLTPLAFPNWESASFFSTSLVEAPPPVNFLDLYIPANPFHSLSSNFVPAVVLFSLSLGIALIAIEEKTEIIPMLSVLSEALVKIAGFVVRLTPIGVFAIAASAAGTITPGELAKLQVYLLTFNLVSLLLAFWVLPALVAVFTPFERREIVRLSRDALVTAFTTGNLFVILPILIDNAKHLFDAKGMTGENTHAYIDVLIPVTFNFPNIGKLIMLMFILFAGWFTGAEMGLAQYPQFVFSGLLSFFGGVDVALPFMLDQMHIPSDMYQLYMVTGIINGRTATLLAAMNLLTFTLLTVAHLSGHLQVRWRRVGIVAVTAVALFAALIGACRFYFETAVDNAYDKDRMIAGMALLQEPVKANVHTAPATQVLEFAPGVSATEQIVERGKLRIGYFPNRLPFSYLNSAGELVGFDVDLIYLFAAELEVVPEFYPVTNETLAEALRQGLIDTAVGGIPVTPPRLVRMVFSAPYLEVRFALIVPDYRRKDFTSVARVQAMHGLRVGVIADGDHFIANKLRLMLPLAEVVELGSEMEFFGAGPADGRPKPEVLLSNAEGGSAWTLLYPGFSVVAPQPVMSQPLAFPVSRQARDLADTLTQWLRIKKDGTSYRNRYAYWILGRGVSGEARRWSVVRDVFGWGEPDPGGLAPE